MTPKRRINVFLWGLLLSVSIVVMIAMSLGTLLLDGIKSNTTTENKTTNNCSTIRHPNPGWDYIQFYTVDGKWFLEVQSIAQNDAGLLKYILKYHLEPPSKHPYNPKIIELPDPSAHGDVIQGIFKGKRNGFYVEAGAFDGVWGSNTLFLEREFGWSGILVEANSFILPELRLTHRKAWIADVCLALTPHPQKVKFIHTPEEAVAAMIQYSAIGKNPSTNAQIKRNEIRKDKFISAGYVECFPLFSLVAALNITTIDYLSLDVEGAELRVLQNIPFDIIDIKVISAEHWILEGGIPALDAFFATKNYTQISRKGQDVFYTQNVLLPEYGLD